MSFGENWPSNDDGSPGAFLLQLPLVAVPMGAWEGRLIAVYLMEHDLLVRSYGAELVGELVATTNPSTEPKVEPRELQALAVPAATLPQPGADGDEDDEYNGLNFERIMEEVPGLKSRLTEFTAYPVQVLSRILAGGTAGAAFDTEESILVGGAPVFIQSSHDPMCAICQQPMRFLFQFGDVTDDFVMGDCGVGYIYGCDTHPEHCQAFVDFF
jgi:hypothetical protein